LPIHNSSSIFSQSCCIEVFNAYQPLALMMFGIKIAANRGD
jgi:hypothetical protein